MGLKSALVNLLGRVVEITSSDRLFAPGGVSTRNGFTGGEDIEARSFEAGDVGFYYGIDVSGTRVYVIGADGSFLVLTHGSSPIGGGEDDFNLDLATGEITMPAFRLANLTADPTTPTPTAGRKYWNTTAGEERTYNGTAWVAAGSGGSPTLASLAAIGVFTRWR